ncbi:MAG: FecR domain-containing protein [Pseudomonadota bacterium]
MTGKGETRAHGLNVEAARIALSQSSAGPDAIRSALDTWAGSDGARRAAADRALRAWAATGMRRRSPRGGLIGLVLIGALLGGAAWQTAPQWLSDITAGKAAITGMRLGDGVLADLDAGTAIDIDSDIQEGIADDGAADVLTIQLHEGAIHLTVDPARAGAVRVIAGNVTAEVTGTRFEVAEIGGDVQIAVSEGSVRVSAPGAATPRTSVSAGQAWRGDATGGTLGAIIAQDVAPWREGWLIANNRPLEEVVEAIDRRFRGAILIADGALGDQPVTGSYRLDDPVSALRAAATARGAQVTQITPWLLIVSRD